jgi:hypothetical protein
MIFAAILCSLVGAVIHWIVIAIAMRNEKAIRQSSSEYASQLYRSRIVATILQGGSVRVTTLLFMSPPSELREMIYRKRSWDTIALMLFGASAVFMIFGSRIT